MNLSRSGQWEKLSPSPCSTGLWTTRSRSRSDTVKKLCHCVFLLSLSNVEHLHTAAADVTALPSCLQVSSPATRGSVRHINVTNTHVTGFKKKLITARQHRAPSAVGDEVVYCAQHNTVCVSSQMRLKSRWADFCKGPWSDLCSLSRRWWERRRSRCRSRCYYVPCSCCVFNIRVVQVQCVMCWWGHGKQ